jgi:hypothetical protein
MRCNFPAHLDAVEFVNGQAAGDGEILDSVVEFCLIIFTRFALAAMAEAVVSIVSVMADLPIWASFGLPKCAGSCLVPSRGSICTPHRSHSISIREVAAFVTLLHERS